MRSKEDFERGLRAVAALREQRGDDDLTTLAAMSQLAKEYLARGQALNSTLDIENGRDLQVLVVSKLKELQGIDHPSTISAEHVLGAMMSAAGDLGGAVEIQERVLQHWEFDRGLDDDFTQQARHNLAVTFQRLGDYVSMANLLAASIDSFRRSNKGDSLEAYTTLQGLGFAKRLLLRIDDAYVLHLEAASGLRALVGEDSEDVLEAELDVAIDLAMLGRIQEAEKDLANLAERAERQLSIDGDVRTRIRQQHAATRALIQRGSEDE